MATLPPNELLFNKISPHPTHPSLPGTCLISDHHSSPNNQATEHRFQYFLMGLDKLHDFGTHYDGVYNLIYNNHFLRPPFTPMPQQNLMGRKIIGTASPVETSLMNKIGALHKLSDLNDKSGSPIVGHPQVNFHTYIPGGQPPILNYSIQAPESIPSIKITDLHDATKRQIYKQNIPDNRDVLLYFTGNKTDFQYQDSYNAFHDILGINDVIPYVSRDAFPLNSDTIKGMLNQDFSSDFTSYTSELMDPATASKTILPNQAEIKVLYCLLTGGKKLFLKARKLYYPPPVLPEHRIELSFDLCDASGICFSTTPGQEFIITGAIPPPSIHDVVIELFRIDSEPTTPRSFTKTKSSICGKTVKFMNMLRTGNKNQEARQQDLSDNYFDPLYNAIPNPNGNIITDDDIKLIDIALKTIGDQTYIWDSLIYDAINPLIGEYKEGSYIVTVDKFLFDNIVWGKNSNAVFASKSNGGSVRDALLGSNYQMVIYLKPTVETEEEKEERKEKEKAEQAQQAAEAVARVANMKKYYNLFKSHGYASLNKDATSYLSWFLDRRQKIVNLLIILFNRINPPEGRAQRNPKQYVYGMAVNEQGLTTKGIFLSPADVGNLYYSACYLLHFIIQTEISLFKIFTHGEPTDEFDNIIDIIDKQKEIDKINKMNGDMKTARTLYKRRDLSMIWDLNSLKDYLHKNPPTGPDPDAAAPAAPNFNQLEESLNKNVERLKENLVNGMPHTVTVRNNYNLVKEKVIIYFHDFMPVAGNNFITGGGKHSRLIKGGMDNERSVFMLEPQDSKTEHNSVFGWFFDQRNKDNGWESGDTTGPDDSQSQPTTTTPQKKTRTRTLSKQVKNPIRPQGIQPPSAQKKEKEQKRKQLVEAAGLRLIDFEKEAAQAEAETAAEAAAEAEIILTETAKTVPGVVTHCWGDVQELMTEINNHYKTDNDEIKTTYLLTHDDDRTLELLEKLEIIKTTYYDPQVQSSDFYFYFYYNILLKHGPNILDSLMKSGHIAFDSVNESLTGIDLLVSKEKKGGNKRKTIKKRRSKNTKKPKKQIKKQNKTKQTRKNKTRKSKK